MHDNALEALVAFPLLWLAGALWRTAINAHLKREAARLDRDIDRIIKETING